MKPCANDYATVSDTNGFVTALYITRFNKTPIIVHFPSEFLAEIKMFHWSYRGKSGIFNDFNESLAGYLANTYGYKGRNWRRKDVSSRSYLPDNYTTKLQASGVDVKNWKPIATDNRFTGRVQAFYERIKWSSKYKCETLSVKVGVYNVPIYVNSYLRHCVPTEADFKDGDLYLFDGTKLSNHIIINAGGGPEGETDRVGVTYTNRSNLLDYRVDPNVLRYSDEPYSHNRLHRTKIDGKDVVIYEQIDSPKDSVRFNWKWQPRDSSEAFLIGENGGWRRSFVMFDAQYLDALYKLSPALKIYYRSADQEWIVSEYSVNSIGETEIKAHQLKRVLLSESGAKVSYEYFAPRLSKSYAAALKAVETKEGKDRLSALKTISKYENATTEEKGNRGKMFVKPKVQHHRKIYALRNYFCTDLYGGVGVWCKDLRCDSLLIGTNAQLQGVVVDKKQDIRKRRT